MTFLAFSLWKKENLKSTWRRETLAQIPMAFFATEKHEAVIQSLAGGWSIQNIRFITKVVF